MVNKITPEIIYKSDAWQKYGDIEQVVKDSCSTVISHFDIKRTAYQYRSLIDKVSHNEP